MTDKKRLALLISFTLLAATVPPRLFAQGGPYPTESGKVEYAVEGMQSGTMIRYWRQWGFERAEYNDFSLSVFGVSQVTQTHTITNAETVTNIDLTTDTATQIANPVSDFYNMSPDQLDNVNQMMMQNMGGQLVGTEVIAGQECEVWELGATGGDMCLWSGVELRNAAGGAMLTMTATSIDTTTSVGDEPFTVPDGVTFNTPGAGTDNVPNLQDLLQGLGLP